MPLTDKQITKYLAHQGLICPVCESRNFETIDRPDGDSNVLVQSVECHDCGKRWTDFYTLTDVQLEDEDDEIDSNQTPLLQPDEFTGFGYGQSGNEKLGIGDV